MIAGFPDDPGVDPGGVMTFRVSTDARSFRIQLFRWGASIEHVGTIGPLSGHEAPQHLPYQDWARDAVGLRGEPLAGWPAYSAHVPAHWRPGVYVAVLVEDDRTGVDRSARGGLPAALDARDGRALFVVRSVGTARAPVLYKLPLFTYHAYNRVAATHFDPATGCGGWSLYSVPSQQDLATPVPPSVSLHRPGGGIGGTPSDIWNRDPFDASPRQTFAHWDAPFIRWLEGNGYDVAYCTDLDLHRDGHGEFLRGYRLLVSAGHDEYWSDEMRRATDEYIADGGNVAFFGGNTCWWRVTFDDEWTFRRDANWCDVPGAPPENATTGVSFRNGGERDLDDDCTPVGYLVQHGDHWVYSGTGLRDGDMFGDGPDEHLVGYECDGATFDRAALRARRSVAPDGEDGTPERFTILGVGDIDALGWGRGNAAATMGIHSPAGTVFNAATTDWARLLASGRCAPVEQITRNVLGRLSSRLG
jgi:hypothetical protein